MENYMGTPSTSSSSGTGSTAQGSSQGSKAAKPDFKSLDSKKGERSRNEDPVTSTIEKATAKVPSLTFLSAAMISMAGSLGFFIAGKRDVGLLMAVWVPTILILGNYNKIVKALENVDSQGSGSRPFNPAF